MYFLLIEWIARNYSYGYEEGFDFEALKFSGVAAVLLATFFSYHRFYNKDRMTSADRPTKFFLVLRKISHFFSVRVYQINVSYKSREISHFY